MASLRYFLIVLMLILQPRVVLAQQEETPPGLKEEFRKGEVQYRLGNFLGALTHYQAALKIARRPALYFNIAHCYRQINEPERALFFYRLFLSSWRLKNSKRPRPPNYQEVRVHIKKLAAEVRIRKEEAVSARLMKRREKEQRQLAQEKRRREQSQRKSQVSARVEVKGIRVNGAKVLVDGVFRGQSPIKQPIEVVPGRRSVRVEAGGHLPWEEEIEVRAGELAVVQVSLKLQPHRSAFWLASTLTSLALAGGAEAMAIVFTMNANEHYQGTPPFEQDRNLAIVGHCLAGAFAALSITSLVLYIKSGRAEPESDLHRVGFLPLPGGGAAVGQFRF